MADYISEHALSYSLTNCRVIAMIYMKGIEITQRKVKVIKMDDDIVKAIDMDKQAIRTFKKENILSAMKLV